MSRLETTQTASEPKPSLWGIMVNFGIIILLSLLGLAGVLVVGYYLPETGAKAYWFISRSSGVVAYLLLTLGVLWGLVQSGSLFRKWLPPVLALGMHSYLNWFGLGLAALHGVILIGDGYINIDLPKVFTPFISPYRPIPVGLGIIGFYLTLLLSLSFYARSYLGQKTFRLLHYGSFGVFVLVTLHSLLSGTDTGALWWLYVTSLIAVTLLMFARFAATRRPKPAPANRVDTRIAIRPRSVERRASGTHPLLPTRSKSAEVRKR